MTSRDHELTEDRALELGRAMTYRSYALSLDAATGQLVWLPDEFDDAFDRAIEQQFGPSDPENVNPHRGDDGVIRYHPRRVA
jgi:hypothetical protein